MIGKFLKIIIILAIIAAVAAVIILNSTSVDVVVTPNFILENYNLGVVLIVAFVLGVLFASIFAFYFSLVSLFQKKKIESEKKQKVKFINTVLDAREAYSAGQWEKSKAIWKGLLKKDPSGVLAKTEMSKALQHEGNLDEALKVINEARSKSPENIEVLFRAVDLNLELGNKTAALDNLALIISHTPNKKAVTLARNLSEEVGRIDDAIEYNEQALNLGANEEYATFASRLEYLKLVNNADASDPDNRAQFKKSLKKFVKRNPKCSQAMLHLAQLEQEDKRVDEAAELIFKASSLTNNAEQWQQAITLWVDNDFPDRALATAKTAVKSTSGEDRIIAELELIRINILVNKLEDAQKLLDQIADLAEAQGVQLTDEIKREYFLLKGLCLHRQSKSEEAGRILNKLVYSDLKLKRKKAKQEEEFPQQPAPRLSTP